MTGLIGETLTLPDESYLVSDTLLGKGGFASVYLAWSSKGESVAIKAVDCNKQSAWAIGKLRTEATALKRAQQHENIVQLFGELRVGQYHVFVLEAWGQDLLDQVLEYKGLGEQRALNVMAQVLRALEWLHERRICHGCASRPAPLPRAAARPFRPARLSMPYSPRRSKTLPGRHVPSKSSMH